MKKMFFTLSFFILNFLTGCKNFVGSGLNKNEISFEVGTTVAEKVAAAMEENEKITYDSVITLECCLLRGDVVLKKDVKSVTLKDLYKTSFLIENIPNGNNYFISLNIGYNNSVIFKSLSDTIILNESKENVSVNLQLKQNDSIISYELNGGAFPHNNEGPGTYFINSDVKLNNPVREHYKFDGWYNNSDFNGEKITTLGKNRFLGNVTLYAKWIKLDQVSSVTFTPDKGVVECDNIITLQSETPDAVIHYTTDGNDPDEKSALYDKNQKLKITEDFIKNNKVIIKAIAIKEGMDNSDITVKEYDVKTYSLSFENNGHGDKTPEEQLRKNSIITSDMLPDLSAEGYIFDGWYNDILLKNSVTPNSDKMGTSPITLYAKWTPITYTVKFDKNDTEATGNPMYNVNFTYDKTEQMPANTYKKSGFAFAGWSTEKAGNPKTNIKDKENKAFNLSSTDKAEITLYAQWNDVAPGNITNFKAETGNSKINLSWTNPDDTDIAQILINYDNKEIQVPFSAEKAGASDSFEITDVTNGSKYTIGIKAEDKGQNVGEAVTKDSFSLDFNSLYKLTEAPVTTTVSKVQFGDWPQSLKAESVCVSENTVKVNNWDCYYGNDSNYYVKVTADPYAFEENYKKGNIYYFKMEPIQWRVLTDAYKDGNKKNCNRLLLSEKALANQCYNSNSDAPVTYNTSDMRKYLNSTDNFENNGFMARAFTQNAISNHLKQTVNVDNSNNSTWGTGQEKYEDVSSKVNNNACDNTVDKVFSLSLKEVTDSNYGFDGYTNQSQNRILKGSDYVRATGLNVNGENGVVRAWGLRSPYYKNTSVAYTVGEFGTISNQNNVNLGLGVVPAITLPALP